MHSGDKINCNLIFKVKPKLRANLTHVMQLLQELDNPIKMALTLSHFIMLIFLQINFHCKPNDCILQSIFEFIIFISYYTVLCESQYISSGGSLSFQKIIFKNFFFLNVPSGKPK